jgi:hypothetical protein
MEEIDDGLDRRLETDGICPECFKRVIEELKETGRGDGAVGPGAIEPVAAGKRDYPNETGGAAMPQGPAGH